MAMQCNQFSTAVLPKSVNKNSIEYIFESPIRCGYFLHFSKLEHNAENLNFLISVLRFRDLLLAEKRLWTRDWRDIDVDMDDCVTSIEDGDEKVLSSWPSKKVQRSTVINLMRAVVSQYLVDGAPNEICISRDVMAKTLKRMKYVDIYGPEVFSEATLDPLKTVKRDILPRFLKSDIASKMFARLSLCESLPSASQLLVLPPDSCILDDACIQEFPLERRFDLFEMLNCSFLYQEFLLFLRQSLCSENLLFFRQISIFEETMDRNEVDEAEEVMWNAYVFFVASGSAYEVSLSSSLRRNFMMRLANPTVDMFDDIKTTVMTSLKRNFEDFQQSPEYFELARLCRSKISSRKSEESHFYSAYSCFGK